MRTIVVLTLRCWVDDEFPGRLRGVLVRADGEDKYAFNDAQSLVEQVQKALETHPAGHNRHELPPIQEDVR